jgi:hypothetical protein
MIEPALRNSSRCGGSELLRVVHPRCTAKNTPSATAGRDLRKHFSGRPSIITTGIQLYEALGEQDTGYAGDLWVTNQWAKILKISEWFTWVGFEDMPESYFKDI